jgi:phage shock protein A
MSSPNMPRVRDPGNAVGSAASGVAAGFRFGWRRPGSGQAGVGSRQGIESILELLRAAVAVSRRRVAIRGDQRSPGRIGTTFAKMCAGAAVERRGSGKEPIMGIFSRLSDIINSNVNSILDQAEDPQKIIRLIVQEMEETLVEVRATAARMIAERKEADRRLQRVRDAQADWDRKAELALRKGREDLSRAALIEKAKLADVANALAEESAALAAALAQGEEDIGKLEAKLRDAKARQKAMLAREETANNRLRTRRTLHDPRLADAFTRFEHVERRIDRLEGEVESYDLGTKKTLSQEIAELEADAAIEAELEALKARLAKERPSS